MQWVATIAPCCCNVAAILILFILNFKEWTKNRPMNNEQTSVKFFLDKGSFEGT